VPKTGLSAEFLVRYRQLGAHGPTVSVLGLGGSLFGRACDPRQTSAVVDAALDAGVTFVDTAEDYPGSEDALGHALKGRRERVVLLSKFGHPQSHPHGGNGRAEVVRASLEGALRRLQTDHLDLYLLHFPDSGTPIEETLGALDREIARGTIRFAGVSNFAAWQVVEAQWTAKCVGLSPLVCVEERYNLLERNVEREITPMCQRYGLSIVPYRPLAGGLLTGRYHRGDTPKPGSRLGSTRRAMADGTFDRVEALQAFSAERGLSLLQVAIGGLAGLPCVGPVITGATTPEQIAANAEASDWVPSADELEQLDTLTRRRTDLDERILTNG
jgi:aryl-alcohol dehydrogenase-like predicted oxidoreductase